MNKKSQQRVQQHNIVRSHTRQVEVRTVDELGVCSEEELQARTQFLHDELHNRRLPQGSREAAPWEIELAYIQREHEIRHARKLRHREYMESQRGQEVDENSLPEYQGNPPPTWN